MTPVANLPPVSLKRWQFATGGKFAAGIVDTSGKLATGVNNTHRTRGKICRRCRWYWRQFAAGVIDTAGK